MLTSRLQQRTDLLSTLASRLMSKAMEVVTRQRDMNSAAKDAGEQTAIAEILTTKLADRMYFEELKHRS